MKVIRSEKRGRKGEGERKGRWRRIKERGNEGDLKCKEMREDWRLGRLEN